MHAITQANWEPLKYDRICGQHFVSGGSLGDPSDIDYVPSVFKVAMGKIPIPVSQLRQIGTAQYKRAKHLEIGEEQAGAITRSDLDVNRPVDNSYAQTL